MDNRCDEIRATDVFDVCALYLAPVRLSLCRVRVCNRVPSACVCVSVFACAEESKQIEEYKCDSARSSATSILDKVGGNADAVQRRFGGIEFKIRRPSWTVDSTVESHCTSAA